MAKEVAMRYSWSGQVRPTQADTKKKFKDMKICTILIGEFSFATSIQFLLRSKCFNEFVNQQKKVFLKLTRFNMN